MSVHEGRDLSISLMRNEEFRFEPCASPCILMVVKSLCRVIAVIMLVLWAPATSLCLVERSGWLDNDDGCPCSSQESPASESTSGSPCCMLASANYKVNEALFSLAPREEREKTLCRIAIA